MTSRDTPNEIPFAVNEWVLDISNGRKAQYTGRSRKVGSQVMVELLYTDSSTARRAIGGIKVIGEDVGNSLLEQLANGAFGKLRDIQRLITFQKLKGTLHEVIYSMEAAQIDFYPYQFKPVLKFINSPTERLILADEVGLGKTIESALVWTELQSRREARRLLIVCPKILTEKWKEELRSKFMLNARIVDFRDLQDEVSELRNVGPSHSFVLIASYTGLRPPKSEIDLLDSTLEGEKKGSPKTRLLREIKYWDYSYAPFDLVIFDEAHYMRNAATSTFNLGESLTSHDNTAVLCVSATPVNNSNNDLHSLLRLIDRDFFETQGMFEELLEANRPTVRAINTLAKPNLDLQALESEVSGMAESSFINNSPLFKQLLEELSQLESNPEDKALLTQAQDSAEKLNLLGNYVNRTRRVQVEGKRPVRDVKVISLSLRDEEMTLYGLILKLVRKLCKDNQQAFHIFRVLGLQLRAASCLPVVAQSIRDGKLGNLYASMDEMNELLADGVGEDVYEEFHTEADSDTELDQFEFKDLVKYDFEGNDSKFDQLTALLNETVRLGEKVVIFSYYRPTLAYLKRRLLALDYEVAVIHGGIEHDQRWEELDRFKNSNVTNILLSSEVGSEGIDLQFCSRLVNYDLPWNPMKVEQRIGRIDRVGQKSDKLSIFNFKVEGTVEERLYERLHHKLILSSNSLGDLETVIGEEVKKLTTDLLSQSLTEEEEERRMDNASLVVQRELALVTMLEDSGEALVGLSDYIQKQIKNNHDKGRFLQPQELEDYLADFFDRNFPGTELSFNTPADGCIKLRLSYEAQNSLEDFIRNDDSLSARSLRQRELTVSFQREAISRLPAAQRKRINFINHLSPLVRWTTHINQIENHEFHKVSAIDLVSKDFEPGLYLYRIERWLFKGLSNRDSLNYGVVNLDTGSILSEEEGEQIIQAVLRDGLDWDYAQYDTGQISDSYDSICESQEDRLDNAFTRFEAENDTSIQIRVARASNHWNNLIRKSEQAIETMLEAGRKESLIRGRRTRLSNELEHKEQRILELNKGGETHFEPDEIAAGIIRVRSMNH